MFINFDLISHDQRHRAWLAARDEARAAFDAWVEAEPAHRSAAYTVYLAAEEREAAAARAISAR
jgi:hypothetical protein